MDKNCKSFLLRKSVAAIKEFSRGPVCHPFHGNLVGFKSSLVNAIIEAIVHHVEPKELVSL